MESDKENNGEGKMLELVLKCKSMWMVGGEKKKRVFLVSSRKDKFKLLIWSLMAFWSW